MIRSTQVKTPEKATAITCLFLDIGGVLLTNGWDHQARKRAAMEFNLDLAELEDRHHLTFDTDEEGKLKLEEYLGRVVFHQERPFTRAQFRRFMFAQSQPYPEIIELIARLKVRHGLKIAVVSHFHEFFHTLARARGPMARFFYQTCWAGKTLSSLCR